MSEDASTTAKKSAKKRTVVREYAEPTRIILNVGGADAKAIHTALRIARDATRDPKQQAAYEVLRARVARLLRAKGFRIP